MLIFTEGGKPEKNPRGKGENNTSNNWNWTHICPEQESNPDHGAGEASTNAEIYIIKFNTLWIDSENFRSNK
jgi:hypothetical protein